MRRLEARRFLRDGKDEPDVLGRQPHALHVERGGSHEINCKAATPEWVMMVGCRPRSRLQLDSTVLARRPELAVLRSQVAKRQPHTVHREVKSASDYCMPRVDSCAPPRSMMASASTE